jgi:hypothetical protein
MIALAVSGEYDCVETAVGPRRRKSALSVSFGDRNPEGTIASSVSTLPCVATSQPLY